MVQSTKSSRRPKRPSRNRRSPSDRTPENRSDHVKTGSMDLAFVFAASLAFYCATLAPTVIWGDSAWLAVDAYYGAFNIGTAGDHPLFVFIGHLLSILPLDVARLVNFEAALFGALAVTMVY